MSPKIVISGTGLYRPEHVVTNEELVTSYNAYADQFNAQYQSEIAEGSVIAKSHSSVAFIEKASGIKQRYAYVKDGILDVDRMRPKIKPRTPDQLSDQAEFALHAAKAALKSANKSPKDIDAVIVSCAYTQRSYPAIAIEVQEALGIDGFGFDMLVACSAATFGLQRAYEMVHSGTAKCVLAINPEITTPQINFMDRDSHFIFGDVAIATIVEIESTCTSDIAYQIMSTKSFTKYSNNIRSDFGYMINANDTEPLHPDQYFKQKGRTVFKEVCPMAAKHISTHLKEASIDISTVKRWWLHQANINMNRLICQLLLDRQPDKEEAPVVLDEFANTASAGSIVAFHLHQQGMASGDVGLICSFGAGYSIGSLIVKKL